MKREFRMEFADNDRNDWWSHNDYDGGVPMLMPTAVHVR